MNIKPPFWYVDKLLLLYKSIDLYIDIINIENYSEEIITYNGCINIRHHLFDPYKAFIDSIDGLTPLQHKVIYWLFNIEYDSSTLGDCLIGMCVRKLCTFKELENLYNKHEKDKNV